jgi:FkbM family methyltransferase
MKQKEITKFIYQKYSLIIFFRSNIVALAKKFQSIQGYSDFGEDKIIENLAPLGSITYLDIGAGHPIIGSNTYYFYRNGYKGISIEPIRFHSTFHKLIRPKDQQINALVSKSKQARKFYEFNPTQYSTTSFKQYKKLAQLGIRPRRIYDVNSVSVNKMIELYCDVPFFISIDCEGYDLEIIKQIYPKNYKKVFAIVIEIPMRQNEKEQLFKILKLNRFNLHSTTKNNYIFRKATNKSRR